MEEWMYRPAFFIPRHLLEVSVQLHAPSDLPPPQIKEPTVPIV
jgi:hypothetical protein